MSRVKTPSTVPTGKCRQSRPGSIELHSGPCIKAWKPVWQLLPGYRTSPTPFGGGLPLEVLMFPEGETVSLEQSAGYFGSVANLSMVPWQVHGGTMVLPWSQRPARCPSQYCECLCKPPRGECRRHKAEGGMQNKW